MAKKDVVNLFSTRDRPVKVLKRVLEVDPSTYISFCGVHRQAAAKIRIHLSPILSRRVWVWLDTVKANGYRGDLKNSFWSSVYRSKAAK